jgi:hypothetical protein
VAAFLEAHGPQPVDPVAALARCIEGGVPGLLFDAGALPPANRGRQFRFFASRRDAIEWPEAG